MSYLGALIDKCIAGEAQHNNPIPPVASGMARLDCSGAAELFFGELTKEAWEIPEDFPSIILPTSPCWLAATAPTKINSLGQRVDWGTRPTAWCALYISQRFKSDARPAMVLRGFGQSVPQDYANGATRWMTMRLYLQFGAAAIVPWMTEQFFLDATGAVILTGDRPCIAAMLDEFMVMKLHVNDEKTAADARNHGVPYRNSLLFAATIYNGSANAHYHKTGKSKLAAGKPSVIA